jgi:hypothetical protein
MGTDPWSVPVTYAREVLTWLSRCLLGAALVLAIALWPCASRAADPLDPKAVPEALKPWTAWVLEGKDDRLCPAFFAHSDISRCAWPSRLELVLGERDGRFTQRWHMDAKRWVSLPGDGKRWPMGVSVDGKAALVVVQGTAPSVELSRGDHVVTGAFAWDSPPESLAVPLDTGLLSLTLHGKVVAAPVRDTAGTVWLQKAATNEEGDALEFVVHRKVTDDIPLVLTTRVELHVSGKNREELLGKALPAGFVPMALQSPLPARLEPDGRLRVQLRPGVYTVELTARGPPNTTTLTRPDPAGPWREGDEVWVFEAKNDYRVVTVEGVASIDPAQTTLPDAWKRLPAYPMKLGATLTLHEERRGDADPPPNQLSLTRTLWLDFDGGGLSARDEITGTLSRDSRLTMAPPTVVGRVAIRGADQFITHLADASRTGVEIREGELVVSADSRIAGDPSDIPAVGWAHDFHQVSGTLHLPPGWRLLHASGVDDVPGTWVRHWSLLELFLALVVAIGIGRLHGKRWGAVTLLLLVLSLPEEGAPAWSWLFVLATEALFRVLPVGWAKALAGGARVAALLIVGLIALPFLVEHVREGMYPALAKEGAGVTNAALGGEQTEMDEKRGGKNDDGSVGTSATGAGAAAPPPVSKAAEKPAEVTNQLESELGQKAEPKDALLRKAPGQGGTAWRGSLDARLQQSNALVYDPKAIVQTGAGVPRWRWTSLALRWSGPVNASQRLHLYLLSPAENLLLAYLRAALLVLLLVRLFPWTQHIFPRGWAPPPVAATAAAIGLLLVLFPAVARADIPDKEILQDLQERLTRPPSCLPTCASSARMTVEVKGGVLRARMAIEASAPTAVPLPGSIDQWTPTEVMLDGKPARGLARQTDGVLWCDLEAGAHQILLEGAMPDRESVQLPLHMKPHRVEVSSDGWTVAGVHEDGLADDDLQLTRVRVEDGGAGASLQPGVLPPFVRVERTLDVGLNWQVDTRVVRVTPAGAAVVLEVPLLPGESVTTADVRVVGGKALVNMGPQATTASWHSVLDQRSPVKLVAPRSNDWVEVWRVDIGPIWHATFSGIPFVHTPPQGGVRIPEWRPWPGEEASVELVRPDGVPGQTLTIDESETRITPGLRATDVVLTLAVRSSRGAQHTVTLPPAAQLESLTINGATQPIRQDGRKVTVPIVPGPQTIVLGWRETSGIAPRFTTPAVDVGAPSVNASTVLVLPHGRWLLFAGGPRVGPAVLFWSELLILLVVSLLLGRNRWTPLRWWHWLLLAIGLSQVSVVSGAVFVGWLLALGWRARDPWEGRGPVVFNVRQAVIVGWSLVALGVLGVSLYQGLLGSPEMQVRGNGSSASELHWFVDRSGPTLPVAWALSVHVLAYRGAMFAWALWSALALLRWLRWGWSSFTTGGTWKKPPPRPKAVPPPPMMPMQPVTQPQPVPWPPVPSPREGPQGPPTGT